MNAVVDLINRGGLALVIAVLAIGAYRRWFVLGWTYDGMLKEKDARIDALGRDRDSWRVIAERGTADAKALIEWALKTSREEKE